jgi:hypothetical protein
MSDFSPLTFGAALLNKFTALTVLVFIVVLVFAIWAVRRIVHASLFAGRIPEDEFEVKRIRDEKEEALHNTKSESDDKN